MKLLGGILNPVNMPVLADLNNARKCNSLLLIACCHMACYFSMLLWSHNLQLSCYWLIGYITLIGHIIRSTSETEECLKTMNFCNLHHDLPYGHCSRL